MTGVGMLMPAVARTELRKVDAALATVRETGRRASVQALQMRAQAAMLDLTEALHAFDLARAGVRVRTARARVDELRARLRLSPGPAPEGQGRGTS